MRCGWGLITTVALVLVSHGVAAAPADGELVAQRPCQRAQVSYDDYVAAQVKAYRDEAQSAAQFGIHPPPAEELPKALIGRGAYEALQAHPTACRQVLYGSDGLKVAAYVWEPADLPEGARLPVVVTLRGGNQDFGKFLPGQRNGMAAEVGAGFIVIGVQYRGVDGGEGHEEFGGADVHDVLNAIALARRLPEADGKNVFLEGFSRGGMEAMLALGAGAEVNAAALVSPWTDLELEAKLRPALVGNVWSQLIPNFAADPKAALASRSGVAIARTKTLPPLLIMHGTTDWRADLRNSTEVAEALKARGRPYELHIFKNDVHGLLLNSAERDRLTIAWFKAHMRQ